MRNYFGLLFLLFLCPGCESSEEVPPEDLLSKEKFTAVMIDVQLVEGMKVHRLGPKREKSPDIELLYAKIFEKHEIEKRRFLETYDYYKQRPDQMELIYEQVLDSLSKLDVEVKKEYSEELRKERKLLPDSLEE
jgi:hypothetical protein